MQTINDLPPLPPGYNPQALEVAAMKLQTQLEGTPPIEVKPASEPEVEQVETSSTEVQPEPEAPAPAETPQAKNFKELKHQLMRVQAERDVIARQLLQKSQQENAAISTEPTAEDQDIRYEPLNFKDDEYIEAKHVNAVAKELKKVQDQLRKVQAQNQNSLAETRLRMEFPDFDSVFTQENCSSLALLDSDLAITINNEMDTYRKAKLAYKSIKQMGIDTQDNYTEEKALIQRNAAKPKPSISISPQQSNSPLTRAGAFENGLTPELKKQLYKEMIESRKGH